MEALRSALEHKPRCCKCSPNLSCWEIWWTWSGSNRRPLPCHGSALPAAPQAHLAIAVFQFSLSFVSASNSTWAVHLN